MTNDKFEISAAYENLRNCQTQLDMDGCRVGVSRQALEEVLDELSRLTAVATNGEAQAAKDVLAERERQKSVEGWTPEHDDHHTDRELARAAAVYALHSAQPPKLIFSPELQEEIPENWPWSKCYFKPYGPRRDLVRAGALILAEIERLDRAAIKDDRQ